MLLIAQVRPFILIALMPILVLQPLALALFHSVEELPFIFSSVLPSVGAFAVGLAILINARVGVTIMKDVRAVSMLQAL